jgi:hypothetical protein
MDLKYLGLEAEDSTGPKSQTVQFAWDAEQQYPDAQGVQQ